MTRTYQVRGTRSPWASPRQIAFLWELSRERVIPADALERLQNSLAQHELASRDTDKMPHDKAHAAIEWLLKRDVRPGVVPSRIRALPTPNEARNVHVLVPGQKRDPAPVGVYKVGDDIYIVKTSRQNADRRYACKLVVSPPRMTENGEEVDFDYVRAPGMVFQLTADDRMSEADMKDFMIKYRKCIRCGHNLKAAKTLQRSEQLGVMVGKTCAKKMGLIPA